MASVQEDPSPTQPLPALSSKQEEQFVRDGFVILRRAFPKDVAEGCRELLWQELQVKKGIDRKNPETWPTHVGLTDCFVPRKEGWENDYSANASDASTEHDNNYCKISTQAPTLWDRVVTFRLRRAIDQLVGGRDMWKVESLNLGWWAVSFPFPPTPSGKILEECLGNESSLTNAEFCWREHGAWHIDGNFQHHVDSAGVGLIPLMLFSDVKPQGGGTVLAAGSHHIVAQLLYQNKNGHGLSSPLVSRLALERPATLSNTVEFTGEAGDVALVHPFLLHARGMNWGREGEEDSVRFLCNPNIELATLMNVHWGTVQDCRSRVEEAIIIAREDASWDRPLKRRRQRVRKNRKNRRKGPPRSSEQKLSIEEAPTSR